MEFALAGVALAAIGVIAWLAHAALSGKDAVVAAVKDAGAARHDKAVAAGLQENAELALEQMATHYQRELALRRAVEKELHDVESNPVVPAVGHPRNRVLQAWRDQAERDASDAGADDDIDGVVAGTVAVPALPSRGAGA